MCHYKGHFSTHVWGVRFGVGSMNEVFCASYTSNMPFLAIDKSVRNMRELLTPRQSGADWPRAHPAESSQLPPGLPTLFPHFPDIFSEVASSIQIHARLTPVSKKKL